MAKVIFPDLWRELCRTQSVWSAFKPSLEWLGIDRRTLPERLIALAESKALEKQRSLLSSLDEKALVYLESLAAINRRQATIASRHTLIANISAPIGLALGLGQIFPEAVAALMQQEYEFYTITAISIAIVGIIATVLHAHIRAKQAEDLHDLICFALESSRHEPAGEE